MKNLLTIAALMILIGCSQQQEPQTVTVHYQCENAPALTVNFYPITSDNNEQAELVLGEERILLPQQISASGFIYGNGRYTIRGKGEELTLEIGRMAPISCHAE